MRTSLFLLGLVVALAFWPGLVGAGFAPRWSALAVGAPFCLLWAEGRDEHAPDGRQGLLLLLVLVLLSGASASLLWTPDPLTGLNELAHLLILATVFYLGVAAEDLAPAWDGLALGVTGSAALAVAQVLGWEGLPQVAVPGGLFVNKNFLAEAGMVALVAMMASGRWWLVPGPVVAVALTTSRAVLGALVLTAALAFMRRVPQLSWLLLVLVSLATVLAFALPVPSAEQRIDFWVSALSDLRWLGHGLGSFQVAYPLIEFAHSEPVQLTYELGVLGVPVVALLIYALGGAHEVEWYVLASVALVGLLSFPLHLPVTGFAAALAAGHLVGGRLRVRGTQLTERDAASRSYRVVQANG